MELSGIAATCSTIHMPGNAMISMAHDPIFNMDIPPMAGNAILSPMLRMVAIVSVSPASTHSIR